MTGPPSASPVGSLSADYCPLVAQLFERATSDGAKSRLPTALVGRAGDAAQGCEVEFQLHLIDGRVGETRFRAYGCPHTVAAASWLADWAHGRTPEEIQQWQWRPLAELLQVPIEKRGRILIVEDALKAAARSAPRNV